MSQTAFEFIQEEDQRNGVEKIDVYDIVNPILGISYGEKFEGRLPKDLFILHSTGIKDYLCPLAGETFPYLLKTDTRKVLKANTWGNGAEYRSWLLQSIKIGNPITLNCHTLVASAFLKNNNPKVQRVVDHINQEKVDFRIKNLRWVSYSENNMSKNRTEGVKEKLEQKIIKRGIVWKQLY